MKIEQIYTGCLSQGSYYIISENEAIIIDPLRETEPYLKRAEQDGVKIKYIFETHFHADFVSGHIDLAKKTGATIVYGPNANPSYPVHIAQDGEQLTFGKLSLKSLKLALDNGTGSNYALNPSHSELLMKSRKGMEKFQKK
jgi:glyoxylase-like metal-dependent hydrolase (beta-lactamase superfamily II)